MPRFSYKAVGPDGEVIEGELEAATRQSVIDRLHAQGSVPIRAEALQRPGGAGLSGLLRFERRRVTRKDLVLFTRELATLLQAGLPLDRAFTILVELSPHGALRTLVESLRERVRGGATLADALADHPEVFPNDYVGMVRAGEAGGTLEGVLGRLAESLERSQAMRESVRSALQYPALVVIMAILSLVVLMTLVIPEFRPLFEGAGAALPRSTQVILAISDLVAAYWWAGLILLIAAGFAFRQWRRRPEGRLRWDRALLNAPYFGDLMRKIETARFARTLGTLLANGVTLLNAIAMTAGAQDNRAFAEAVGRVQGRLAKGEGLAAPLGETGVVPGLALRLVQVGEESGRLEAMLIQIAEIYDQETRRSLERLLGLLVPLVTIALGILIAIIIGSMLAAILSVYELPF